MRERLLPKKGRASRAWRGEETAERTLGGPGAARDSCRRRSRTRPRRSDPSIRAGGKHDVTEATKGKEKPINRGGRPHLTPSRKRKSPEKNLVTVSLSTG